MYDEIRIGNPYFIQTIELLRYLDKLRSLNKRSAPSECDSSNLPRLRLKSNKLNNQNKYTKESIDDVCRKTMMLLLTHAGYHNVDPDCFNLLNDLLKSYLKNLTSLFGKKLDQESILNAAAAVDNQSDRQLVLLGKVFNELGTSFSHLQQFNYGLVLYRDHVLNQIDDLRAELNLPTGEDK